MVFSGTMIMKLDPLSSEKLKICSEKLAHFRFKPVIDGSRHSNALKSQIIMLNFFMVKPT